MSVTYCTACSEYALIDILPHEFPFLYWSCIQGTAKTAPRTSHQAKRDLVTIDHLKALHHNLDLMDAFNIAVLALACIMFWCCCHLGELLIDTKFNPQAHVTLYCITPALVRYILLLDRIPHIQMMTSLNICGTVFYNLWHPCSHPSHLLPSNHFASIQIASVWANHPQTQTPSADFHEAQLSSTHLMTLAQSVAPIAVEENVENVVEERDN